MNRQQVRRAVEAQAAFFGAMLDEADREVEGAAERLDRVSELAERKSRELAAKEAECASLKTALAEVGQLLAEEQLRRAEYQGNDARCRRALEVLRQRRLAPDGVPVVRVLADFAEALEGPTEDRSSAPGA